MRPNQPWRGEGGGESGRIPGVGIYLKQCLNILGMTVCNGVFSRPEVC